MKSLLRSVPVALVLFGIAACGGQQDPDPGQVPTDPHQKMLAFAKCMRENGVDMPDPEPNGDGTSMPGIRAGDAGKAEKAMAACRQYAPPNIANPDDPAAQAEDAAFAKCMREHGIDMPDPGTGGGTVALDGPADKLRDALKACRK
ncbi:hypothetical protein [Amycolatopsis sacchari]|uniref:hypothetical protein n=1 Tax=Amycolatopsis sacchari TaxID=115433 RepID=UPI003D7571CC